MHKKEKKEKNQWDRVLEEIDFKGMSREEGLGQEEHIKQLTGRILRRVLESGMDMHPGYENTMWRRRQRGTVGTAPRPRPYQRKVRRQSFGFLDTATGHSSADNPEVSQTPSSVQ
jgi:hypothetical protein